MLTAGDESGRTQQGNNNAYVQDNAIGWVDWAGRDTALEAEAFALAALRAGNADLRGTAILREAEVTWLDESGAPLSVAQWEDPQRRRFALRYCGSGLTICVNGDGEACRFLLEGQAVNVAARSVLVIPPAR